MPMLPSLFLFRVSYPCRHVKDMPREDGDELLDLPESCRLDNFAAMDGHKAFADVRIAWNELGLGLRVEVRGIDKRNAIKAVVSQTWVRGRESWKQNTCHMHFLSVA